MQYEKYYSTAVNSDFCLFQILRSPVISKIRRTFRRKIRLKISKTNVSILKLTVRPQTSVEPC